MSVTLLTHTTPLLATMYTAAATCYSPRTPQEIWNDACNGVIAFEKQAQIVLGCINKLHSSVMRHGNFTWAIAQVSRLCADQFVRHSAGITHDMQSQRYVSMLKLADCDPLQHVHQQLILNAPENITDNHSGPELLALDARIDAFLQESRDLYQVLLDHGFKVEEARRVTPIGVATNLVTTANLHALLHLWAVRVLGTTGKAQNEIRYLVERMVERVLCAEPWLKPAFPPAPEEPWVTKLIDSWPSQPSTP